MTDAERWRSQLTKRPRRVDPGPVGQPDFVFTTQVHPLEFGEVDATSDIPPDLRAWWALAGTAEVDCERNYGIAGLVLWSMHAASQRHVTARVSREEADLLVGDLFVGRYLGDQDLVLIRCDAKAADFGHVILSRPIDRRADWPVMSRSFSEFMELVITRGIGKSHLPG